MVPAISRDEHGAVRGSPPGGYSPGELAPALRDRLMAVRASIDIVAADSGTNAAPAVIPT